MFRKVELPTIQSMKRPKSSVFPLFIHWLRMESVLLQNPVIIGLGLTLLYVALFGKSILLLCIIFVSFSIISIFLPLSDRFLWKDGTKDLVDVTFSWRELNQSGWWNSISADSIMQNMFQKIRWIRNRIHQVPEIVFFNILLLSEYLQECDNHFLKRVISHVSIISLLCILCNISIHPLMKFLHSVDAFSSSLSRCTTIACCTFTSVLYSVHSSPHSSNDPKCLTR